MSLIPLQTTFLNQRENFDLKDIINKNYGLLKLAFKISRISSRPESSICETDKSISEAFNKLISSGNNGILENALCDILLIDKNEGHNNFQKAFELHLRVWKLLLQP